MKKFSHIYVEAPTFQLAPDAPCPIFGCCWEDPDSILLTLTPYIFINLNEVTPQSLLLLPKEKQLPQPLLVREILHSLSQLCGSALDSLKQLPVLLELRGPKLDTIFQMQFHQVSVVYRLVWPSSMTSGAEGFTKSVPLERGNKGPWIIKNSRNDLRRNKLNY